MFVWGGDGMVQRSIDRLAGSGVTLAIIPAGTANLFASSLDIPSDIEQAVEIGLNGRDRTLDVGKINGERFAVMAGAGLDAHMIHDADGGLKDRFGRLAYIWTASKNLRARAVQGANRHQRRALVQGQGQLRPARQRRARCSAASRRSTTPSPTTACSRSGVTNAEGLGQWARTVARTAVGTTEQVARSCR